MTKHTILAIETSCDETSAAVIKTSGAIARIASNIVASQAALHAATGGVVPEVAAREHVGPIIPSVIHALRNARRTLDDIASIAVTAGPGLHTALAVGIDTAKTLSYSLSIPLIPINHILGHIAANWNNRKPALPALALVVSGGHTELILISKHMSLRRLGSTRDDAAGECFDKTAQLLRLGYPGGPAIERMAAHGDPSAYDLPRPMLTEKNLEFSFAGLKTSVRYLVDTHPLLGKDGKPRQERAGVVADLCASVQRAITDVLVEKTLRAAQQYRPKEILLAGGVAANIELRRRLSHEVRLLPWHPSYHQPPLSLCMDNAGMIGLAAFYFSGNQRIDAWRTVDIRPTLSV